MEGRTLNGYLFVEELGRGAVGVVYKAKKNQKFFAIKSLLVNSDSEKNKEMFDNIKTEEFFANHINLECPFLVKYLSSFRQGNHSYLVMEYCSKGDLDKLIKTIGPAHPSEQRIMGILIQSLLGVKCLHENKIIHRDLKTGNVFVGENDEIKLGDFGCGKVLDSVDVASTFKGSLPYMAPEIFLGEKYSYPVDVWALGVMFYRLCTGVLPFRGAFIPLSEAVVKGEFAPIPENLYTSQLRELINSMLRPIPTQRPTVVELLQNLHVQKFAHHTGLVSMNLKSFFPPRAIVVTVYNPKKKVEAELEVNEDLTIGALKLLIAQKNGVNPEVQNLFFAGVLLDDERALSYYDMPSKSKIGFLHSLF